ncbi:MAG: hypothetical protein AVDCRST_MAG26-4439 [uncultured Chloroflexia bacterium]|uniref:Glycosyl transferase, group 1 n=1 Tax=uncultured Chloroflexia bacterium TaxID=1672391 RepID=A0A6J4K525_9CHLR|nr:MAG: hypothetical protein AVDCRST_MAG26-4439 [uncultured Chloroflexia bacterium]
MRVVLDARAIGPHFPGIGRATLGLLRGLVSVEHDEQVVVVHNSAQWDLIEQTGASKDGRFRLAAVEHPPLGMAQQWGLLGFKRAVRANLWHAPYYLHPHFGLPPTVVTIGDLIGPSDAETSGMRDTLVDAARRLLWRMAMRLSVRGAAHIITYSASARRELESAYALPPNRITVIPLGTDEHFQPQSCQTSAALRARYALPERYVLYLGSNKPHKNLRSLVEAWSMVALGLREEAGEVPLSLVIAGREDPRFQSARTRVAELGLDRCVRFLPDVPDADLPALLGGALVFVFPSLAEGFGLPPLEAMACGTPVIASDRDSIPEVVGDAGLLVEPRPPALAAALQRLIDDDGLRRELSVRGLRRAAQFSWASTARATLDVYRAVAGRGADG